MISRSSIEEAHTKEGHFYDYQGQTIPSVNTYLDVMHVQALEDWKLKQERVFAADVSTELYDSTKRVKPLSSINYRLHLEARMKQLRKQKKKQDRRAVMGTMIHDAIEAICKQRMGGDVVIPRGPEDDYYEQQHFAAAMEGFKRWMDEKDFVPLSVEAPVVHLPLYFAGKMDIKGTLDGRPTIVDVKTGAKIYKRHKVQVYNYRIADNWMEQEPAAEAQLILKLGRSQYEDLFEPVPVDDDSHYQDYLQWCRNLYERGED